jgi:hypothetical protein
MAQEEKVELVKTVEKKEISKNNNMDLIPSKHIPEVGNYIMKTNYNTFGRDEDAKPVVKITRVTPMLGKKGGFSKWQINGAYQMDPNDFDIIEESEAMRIMGIWEDSSTLSPVSNDNINTKCIREDNGKAKATYPGRLGWRRPLFMFKMKNPDGGFQAYTCPECGKVHIGKTIEVSTEKVHINEALKSFSFEDLLLSVEEQLDWQKEGNSNGYPWEKYQGPARKLYENYIKPLEGEGFTAWFASYNLVCKELAERVYMNSKIDLL